MQTTDDQNPFEPPMLHVKVRKFGSPKIADLLKATVMGTEGKLRYRQKEIVERMKSQRNIEFIEIVKGTRVLGTTGIVTRHTHSMGKGRRSLYVRYLSMAKGFKRRKQKKTLFSSTKNYIDTQRKSALRDQIGEQITNHFEAPFIDEDREGAFYAYVESDNINSRNLCLSMDFEPVRTVQTLLFSRFYPSEAKCGATTGYADQLVIKKKLAEFYGDYSFYFEDQVFDEGFYFVLKKKDQIIAGIRATPVHWQLMEYPGFEGWLMTEILPYIPLTNKLFSPAEFRFLAFDYIFHEDGKSAQVTELMEHCCALLGFNVGMIWGDAQAPITQNLLKNINLGFLHSIVGAVSAELMVRFINTEVDYEQIIHKQPVFVSALDMT